MVGAGRGVGGGECLLSLGLSASVVYTLATEERKKGQNNGSINRKLGLSFQFQVFQTAK